MVPVLGSRRNPYVRASCGHWTTYEYCVSHGAVPYEHIRTPREGGRLKRDGTPDPRWKELRADIPCARCRPKTPAEVEEERERRREYARRRRLRDRLEFACPLCGKRLRARRDSGAFESFAAGSLGEEEARRRLLGAHLRHEHTDYDRIRKDEYERLRRLGYGWEEAHAIAKEKAAEKVRGCLGELRKRVEEKVASAGTAEGS
jgi:hypothetical protein